MWQKEGLVRLGVQGQVPAENGGGTYLGLWNRVDWGCYLWRHIVTGGKNKIDKPVEMEVGPSLQAQRKTLYLIWDVKT